MSNSSGPVQYFKYVNNGYLLSMICKQSNTLPGWPCGGSIPPVATLPPLNGGLPALNGGPPPVPLKGGPPPDRRPIPPQAA